MLDDLEAKLNATLEQNVLLQSEVEDKDNLNVCFGNNVNFEIIVVFIGLHTTIERRNT
jgi:hypothetical protein